MSSTVYTVYCHKLVKQLLIYNSKTKAPIFVTQFCGCTNNIPRRRGKTKFVMMTKLGKPFGDGKIFKPIFLEKSTPDVCGPSWAPLYVLMDGCTNHENGCAYVD